MARKKSKNKAVCQNNCCKFFRKEKGKDIIKQGKNYAGHMRFLCKHCRTYFVETKGGPLYRRRLSERKIKEICKELVKKNKKNLSKTARKNLMQVTSGVI